MLFAGADSSGRQGLWANNGTTIVGGGAVGDPGAGCVFQGVADLNGNHQDSILFMNTSTGQYATWALNDTAIVGGANLGAPGSAWTEKAFV